MIDTSTALKLKNDMLAIIDSQIAGERRSARSGYVLGKLLPAELDAVRCFVQSFKVTVFGDDGKAPPTPAEARRALVYRVLDTERDHQEAKWGPTPSHGRHSLGEFLVFIDDYLAEAKHQLSRGADPAATNATLHTLRKIVAMGVACMEQNGALPRVDVMR